MKKILSFFDFIIVVVISFVLYIDNAFAVDYITDEFNCVAFSVEKNTFVGISNEINIANNEKMKDSYRLFGFATKVSFEGKYDINKALNMLNWKDYDSELGFVTIAGGRRTLKDAARLKYYKGGKCPDVILANQDRNAGVFYELKSDEQSIDAIERFYNNYNTILNGKHFCWFSNNCHDYYAKNLYVTFNSEQLENINKKIEENYINIQNEINAFRKYFNYGANSEEVPKIGCPGMFVQSDFTKYSNDKLYELLDDSTYMTTQFAKIVNAYNDAINYYNDESVFPGLAFFMSPDDPQNSEIKNLKGLKDFYDKNSTDNITKDFYYAPYAFRKYLNNWVESIKKYDLSFWQKDVEVLTNHLDKEIISDDEKQAFINSCVVNFKNNVKTEIDSRYNRKKISEEEYKKLNDMISTLEEETQKLLQNVSSLYNTFNDFYGENSIISCEAILTTDFIEWLEWAYKFTEIIAILLVIIFSILDFMKAITSSDGDAIKKSSGKFVKRLACLLIIFLLPILINFIIKMTGISGFDTDNPVCIKVGD